MWPGLWGAQARAPQHPPILFLSLLAFITAIACISPMFLFNKCLNFSKSKKQKTTNSLRERGKGEPKWFFVLRKLSVFLRGDESFCVLLYKYATWPTSLIWITEFLWDCGYDIFPLLMSYASRRTVFPKYSILIVFLGNKRSCAKRSLGKN